TRGCRGGRKKQKKRMKNYSVQTVNLTPVPPVTTGTKAEFGGERYNKKVQSEKEKEAKEKEKKEKQRQKAREKREEEKMRKEEEREAGKAPDRQLVTQAKGYMERHHGIVSLETGSLCRLVKRNIDALVQQLRQQQQQHVNIDNLANGIITLVDELVMHMNRHRRWIHYVLDLYISNPNTPAGDIARLMGTEASTIVYGIGNRLRMTLTEVRESAQNTVSNRIAIRAVEGAYATLGRVNTILDPFPTGTSATYNETVRFIINEYTQFFTRADEDLKNEAEDGEAFMSAADFDDNFMRPTEINLRDAFYARTSPFRNEMIRCFGRKEQCRDVVHALFVQNTRYAKTTMSMHDAIGMGFFSERIPDENQIRLHAQEVVA
ncbi:hypothetical protein BGX26_007329, partial [Mortierella sp. AD094]